MKQHILSAVLVAFSLMALSAGTGLPELREPARPGRSEAWPQPAELHPRVTSIPSSEEANYQMAAAYLVRGENNPFQRIKALHDYIADRVAYDSEAYVRNQPSHSSPEDVFASRKALCEGYANLFAAMGQAVGEEVVTLSGDSLGFRGTVEGHAWNAVRIKGNWYLVDVSWNAGYIDGAGRFFKKYRTHYLFTPPQEFARQHLPTEPGWQLMSPPLSRADFLRGERGAGSSPPSTASAGISIRTPMGPRPEVRGRFPVELHNPQGLRTRVRIVNTSDGSFEECPSEYAGTRFACTVLGRGTWRIEVFAVPSSETSEALETHLEVMGT